MVFALFVESTCSPQKLCALCACALDGSLAYYAHIQPRIRCGFLVFVSLAQLINSEFLAFPLRSPNFLTVAVPLYCLLFVQIFKS